MTVKLGELAQRCDGLVRGDPNVAIDGVATLERAGSRDISYVAGRKYYPALAATHAGAVILAEHDAERFSGNALIVDNPRLCFARVASRLNPGIPVEPGVHGTALIDGSAIIADSAWIGPYAVVEADAVIERNVFIGPGCYVGARAAIGADSRLAAHVVVSSECSMGKNCIIHPGVIVGADGFGFVQEGVEWVKVLQLGRVRIGDNVEIGANTTIDRGALDDTVIENGVKLDNLIQVAHNVHIGEHTVMAAGAKIAGSTRIGKRCMVGGQVGIAEHLEVADDVRITAQSLVSASITESGAYSSSLKAEPVSQWRRNAVRLRQLDDLASRLRALEKKVKGLSEAREN